MGRLRRKYNSCSAMIAVNYSLAVIARLVRSCALRRAIQYSRVVAFEQIGRGVLDSPLEPIIGRAFARPVGGE